MTTATYSAGTAYLTVVPSFVGIEDAFRRQVRDMAQAADRELAQGMARGLREANRQAKNTGQQGGRDWAGAYASEARRQLDKAWKSLPEPQPGVNLRKWDKALADVRRDMKELSEQRIGIDIDRETFDRALADFRQRLENLRDTVQGRNSAIGFYNADQAANALSSLEDFNREAVRRAQQGGDQAGSAFTERMARVLRSGVGAIPEVEITADSTDAERAIADLRTRMAALRDQRIGIDIDAGAAYAELRAILEELNRLDRTSVRVDIRTNAHEAAAGIGQFVQQAEQAGRGVENIGTGANFSMSRLEYLIALGASLGTSIVPAALAAAGAVGMIGTAALAAVSGIGVFALGISGVSDAVKALNGYAQDQAKSAQSVDQANQRVASSTNQVRMAQLALENTRRNVAEGAADAARRVADAERAVGDARRQAAIDAQDAARAVRDARKAAQEAEEEISDARRQAARDLAEANRQVRDAQRDVTEAEADAREVRLSLNEALKEAVRNMAELDTALKRNEVDQQKAVTAQLKALEELNALKTNPRATEVELRQAQDAYDEQTVRIEELKNKHEELAADKANYDKKGVEGDKAVIAARKQIIEADQRVADAREKLAREQDQRRETEIRNQERIQDALDSAAKSQEAVGRAIVQQHETELRSQERVADAERSVADARRQQQRQRTDGEYQILQATNSVSQAQDAQAQAWDKVGTSGGAALEKLNEAMGELSPAGQDFAKFLFGLKDELAGLRSAAAEPLLPQLQTAIEMALQYLPDVEKFIGKVADVVGELAIKTVEAFGSPVWQRFFGYVDKTAVPSLETLWEIGNNLTQGLINLFLALTPFNDQVGTGLVDLSRDFATWAERLDKTQGYQDFLDYVSENGPRVVHFLGEVGELFIDLVKAAAPLGSVVLRVLTLLVDTLNSLPDGAMTGLVLGVGALAFAFTGLGAVMRVIKLRQQLTEIFGPRVTSMVQQYAIDTGRATNETDRLGKATATMSGYAQNARDRVSGLGGAIGQLGGKLMSEQSLGPLSKGMDQVRTSSLQAAAALNGPGGVAGAVQAAQRNVAGLAGAGEIAARQGMGRLRQSLLDVAAAANGPGGMAAGVQAAGGKLGGFTKAAGNTAVALGGKLMSGLSTVSSFVGGPWVVALAGATAVIGALASASADYNGKIDTLATTLGDLGTQYKDLQQSNKLGTGEATELLDEIARRNPEMRNAVINLNDIGVSMEQLGKAAAGSQEDLNTILAALDEEIDITEQKWQDQSNFLLTVWSSDARATSDRLTELRQLREAVKQNADQNKVATDVQRILNGEDERAAAIAQIKTSHQQVGIGVHQKLISLYDTNAAKIHALTGLISTFSDAESTASEKADAMRAAIENQTGAVVNAIEADEQFNSKLISLREQVNQSKDAHDKHATSLDLNSTTALRNRDALEDVATSIREMYLQDIASGTPMDVATKKHQDRINKLRDEASKLGLTKSKTDELIKAYGEVPDDVTTVLKMDPNSFQAVYKDLQRVQFMQNMLKVGMSADQAEKEWAEYQRELGRAVGKAAGGPIVGPGTKTSDSVLLWGSDGEFMQRAAAVDYYGEDAMHAINQKKIPRELLHGYAHGGLIGEQPTAKPKENLGLQALAGGGKVSQIWPFQVDISKTLVPDEASILSAGGLSLGGASGGPGYKWQMKVLRKAFPGLELISGYRPGSRTLSGNLSWHARGRAVDVPAKRTVAEWIAATYGKNTLELITPWRDLMLYKGKPHKYSEAVERQHGVGRASNDHVHWAFDDGGYLPPGASTVINETGKPEPILTSNQWKTIETFVNQGMAGATGRSTNNYYEFRDTTLDANWVRSQQQRNDTMDRIDRAY